MPPPANNNETASQTVKESTNPPISWVEETDKASERDPRAQPWKETFGNQINHGAQGSDVINVRGDNDVQHNGMVGAA